MGLGLKQLGKDAAGVTRWLYPEEIVVATPPSSRVETIFGYNTLDSEGTQKMQRWGRVPMARCYNGGAFLNPNGDHFKPGGLCYRAAGLSTPGVESSRRVNMSVTYNPASVTSSASSLYQQFRAFAAAIPSGWYVQLVMHHEYNLHTTEREGAQGVGSLADFKRSHKLLAQAIVEGDNGAGRIVPVINPSWDAGNLKDSESVPAAEMPLGTEWHNDAYDNPRGVPTGYKGYGTSYQPLLPAQDSYDIAVRLGYTQPGYGWGIDEFNAPRRVAPRLATLDTTTLDGGGKPIGWGPLSPSDLDGSGQAKSITDYCTRLLDVPVPPTTVLLFTTMGNLWNQKFTTAGTTVRDAVGPLHQGWPINVDPSKPYAAYQAFIDISA